MKAVTSWQAAVLGRASMAIALSTSLPCFTAITAAHNALTVQEFRPIRSDPTRERVQLKGDLTAAVQRAGDAVNQSSQPVLNSRLKQLSEQAAKLIRALGSSDRLVALRPRVNALVSKLDDLESEALKVTGENQDRQALLRSRLENRLTVALAAAKRTVQDREPDAQNELEGIAADAANLKGAIRRAHNAEDFDDLERHVAEIEDRTQRLAKVTQPSSRRFDATQLLVGMGLLTSTATGVVLTLLFLRMRQQIARLWSVHGNAPQPVQELGQTDVKNS